MYRDKKLPGGTTPFAVIARTWCSLDMPAHANLPEDDPKRFKEWLVKLVKHKPVPGKPE
jgi:hypothetical protein